MNVLVDIVYLSYLEIQASSYCWFLRFLFLMLKLCNLVNSYRFLVILKRSFPLVIRGIEKMPTFHNLEVLSLLRKAVQKLWT